MARRKKEFSESAMFHGSNHPFSVGDLILPEKDSTGKNLVHATNYLSKKGFKVVGKVDQD